jgi:DNA-binding transcriptional LysR family regulator
MSSAVDLAGMALFVKIVESGSLSAAGRALGLPKATVSRRFCQRVRPWW